MKTFIILGGNFVNTGAEAMTFITVDALKRKYPDCKIVVFSNLDARKDNSNYDFNVIHMSGSALSHAGKGKASIKYYIEGLARILLKKGNQFEDYKQLRSLLEKCDGVFDISGYTISSQFKNRNTLGKLSNVDLFTSHNIPFYFMPQSFGPFNYEEDHDHMIKRLKETLPKATKIFAREQEGYDLLAELIGKQNLVRSYDMVLQSGEIDKRNIYKRVPDFEDIPITTEGNVAIVPNMRNFDHGNKNEILALYTSIITRLLEADKNIYLISHSAEDIEACRIVKEQFANDSKVQIIEKKINSWNYDTLIRHFDFAIASRFHSIVHAYKAGVPCVSLGWATKYQELLKAMGQQEYIIDVRDLADMNGKLAIVQQMNERHSQEREIIQTHLSEIQKTNCFDMLDF